MICLYQINSKLLGKHLKHDVATELDKHRETIQQMLEAEIIASYYYQAGAIEAGLSYDKQYLEAVKLLKNAPEYRKILVK